MRSVLRFLLVLICLAVLATHVQAQSKAQVADSLKKVVAGYRGEMLAADTTGNAQAAVNARLKLASLVKPKEALRLLEQAVALADSADLAEEGTARTALAAQFARSGNHRRAYEEALRLVVLGNARLSKQAEASGARHAEDVARAVAEQDSLQLAWHKDLTRAESAMMEANARAGRWMWLAVSAGALCLIVLLAIGFVSSRAQRRTRKEIGELRAELEAIKAASQNRIRETAPTPAPIAEAPPVIEASPPPEVPVVDPLALAFLRKMAPERLGVLRDARTRGDHEKVVRVVHTLKPQLVALDATLFADLCAAITAKDAALNTPEWNADVDRFEKAVERAIA